MSFPRLSEQFLRFVWQRRILTPGPLATTDGKRLDIVSSGILNTDGGPDFREAVVCIDGRRFRGDVELHLAAGSWYAHGHAGDPHYNRVILHVVLTLDGSTVQASTAAHRSIPVLVISPFLPADAIEQWHRLPAAEDPHHHLPCAPSNRTVDRTLIREWLESLGRERFRVRARLLEERFRELVRERTPLIRDYRLHDAGNPDEIPPPSFSLPPEECLRLQHWDQLLYECVMEGLGYGKNQRAFLDLARAVRLDALRRVGMDDPITTQAVLFGAAGLLPCVRDLRERESRMYVRALRKRWKELHPLFRIPLLHEGDWLFFRLRPVNFPTARLATAAFLLPRLFVFQAFRHMIGLLAAVTSGGRRARRDIEAMLFVVPDRYWARHVHFRQTSSSRGIGLGPDRVTDVMVNAILPVAWVYAGLCDDHRVKRGVEAVFNALPAPPANAITRKVQQDLLLPELRCHSVLLSQGALHLFKNYCRRGKCAECVIGQAIGNPQAVTPIASRRTSGGRAARRGSEES